MLLSLVAALVRHPCGGGRLKSEFVYFHRSFGWKIMQNTLKLNQNQIWRLTDITDIKSSGATDFTLPLHFNAHRRHRDARARARDRDRRVRDLLHHLLLVSPN